jgi:hypothetical protein
MTSENLKSLAGTSLPVTGEYCMPISEAAMARYREKASTLELSPEEADEAILILYRIIQAQIDLGLGDDSAQLCLWEKAENAGRTQEEHAKLSRMISHNSNEGTAGQNGGEG